MTNEEAIVQLEIDATNLVGRLASEPVHDTSFSELWTRKLEAIDIAIYAIKMFDKHEAECERCACNLLAERTGRWIDSPNIPECMVCSECLSDGLSAQLIAPVPDYYRYCPCCGAHMIGGTL